jgi:hypothetical protein
LASGNLSSGEIELGYSTFSVRPVEHSLWSTVTSMHGKYPAVLVGMAARKTSTGLCWFIPCNMMARGVEVSG